MLANANNPVDPRRAAPRAFDVICAGEAVWKVTRDVAHFRPDGGAVNAALALADEGLHVGLATVLADDTFGRALVQSVGAQGVDVGGVDLAQPSSGLFFVTGGARQVVSYREEEQPVTIPEGWSSQVLLLSGMSPVVSHGAALCKAARAARRQGTIVVVDVNAKWHLWKGRDPRAIRMVLREADVVWVSAEDLLGLNMDLPSLRAALRETAVLAMSNGTGETWATGPFGEVTRSSDVRLTPSPVPEGDAFTAAICGELARCSNALERNVDLWDRALQRGQATVNARRAKR
jgi:2-dehydro-3-deoxygluconokinase